jgi:MFS superfamily sulfate permease-like transporter
MNTTDETLATPPRNRFDRMEIAGAFGDLGTLIPFVVAYLSVLKMDPLGVLLAFGLAMIACGLFYRTPIPVQPMKAAGAIATTQAAQTLVIAPAAVWAAGLVTGAVWLVLGLTGTARYVGRLVSRPVVLGIILGLGFNFMLGGAKMMAENWWIGAPCLLITCMMLKNRVVPAMFALLVFGVTYGLISDPILWAALKGVRVGFRLPAFTLDAITLHDLAIGAVFLALPQIPLTLGNAVIAITEENNRLFPQRPVDENTIAKSTGLMNLFGAAIGGVPMCHGAGGMAGHVQFGARTGGAPMILGIALILTALLFSDSVATLLQMFPAPVLGVILFLTGAQLALGSCDLSKDKGERFVTLVTAGLSIWNVGIAFAAGMIGYWLCKKALLRL